MVSSGHNINLLKPGQRVRERNKMQNMTHLSIVIGGIFNEATTYGAKGDVSCKAELIP